MVAPLAKLTYQVLQKGKGAFSLAHKEISLRLLKTMAPDAVVKTLPLEPGTTKALHNALDALLEREARRGRRNLSHGTVVFQPLEGLGHSVSSPLAG